MHQNPDVVASPALSHRLAELLSSLFTPDEFQRFFQEFLVTERKNSAKRVIAALPPPGSGTPVSYFDAVASLLSRHGLDRVSELYRALGAERADRQHEISELANVLGAPLAGRIEKKNPYATLDALAARHQLPRTVPRRLVAHDRDGNRAEPRDAFTAISELLEAGAPGARGRSFICLAGELGSGRSRLAYEFAQASRDRYGAILMLSGVADRMRVREPAPQVGELVDARFLTGAADIASQDQGPILQKLRELAVSWTLSKPDATPEVAVRELGEYLRAVRVRALIVLDDVLVPSGAVHAIPQDLDADVIVISELGDPWERTLALHPLEEEEALSLLLYRRPGRRPDPDDRRYGMQLVLRFRAHPLAMAVLSALLVRSTPRRLFEQIDERSQRHDEAEIKGGSARALLAVTRNRRAEVVRAAFGEEAVRHVSDTLQPMEAMRELIGTLRDRAGIASNDAEEQICWLVLRALAWVQPNESVSEDLLDLLILAISEGSRAQERARFRTNYLANAVLFLKASGLIVPEPGTRLSVHPLIQQAIRDLDPRKSAEDAILVLDAMRGIAQRHNVGELSYWRKGWETLEESTFLHLLAGAWSLGHPLLRDQVEPGHLELCWRLVRQLQRSGQTREAVALGCATELLATRASARARSSLDRVRLLTELAAALREIGGSSYGIDEQTCLDDAERVLAQVDETVESAEKARLNLHIQYRQSELLRDRGGPESLAAALERLKGVMPDADRLADDDEDWEWSFEVRKGLARLGRLEADLCPTPAEAGEVLTRTLGLLQEAIDRCLPHLARSSRRERAEERHGVLLSDRAAAALARRVVDPHGAPSAQDILRDLETSRELLARTREEHTWLGDLAQILARLHLEQGALEEARAHAEHALDIEEKAGAEGRTLGLAYLLLGRVHLQRALKARDETSPEELKDALEQASRRLDEARARFKALVQDPSISRDGRLCSFYELALDALRAQDLTRACADLRATLDRLRDPETGYGPGSAALAEAVRTFTQITGQHYP